MGEYIEPSEEQTSARDTWVTKKAVAAEGFKNLGEDDQVAISKIFTQDPPVDPGSLSDAAKAQYTKEMDRLSAQSDFLKTIGIKYDITKPSVEIIGTSDSPNIDNLKVVQKTVDKMASKPKEVLNAEVQKVVDDAKNDPKDPSKGNWAAAVTAIATSAGSLGVAIAAIIKGELEYNNLKAIFDQIAKGMSGCFELQISTSSSHHMDCTEDDNLQGYCVNADTNSDDMKLLQQQCSKKVNSGSDYIHTYRKYTYADILADLFAGVMNIPNDIGLAFNWILKHKWYILGAVIVLILALLGIGMAKKYATG